MGGKRGKESLTKKPRDEREIPASRKWKGSE